VKLNSTISLKQKVTIKRGRNSNHNFAIRQILNGKKAVFRSLLSAMLYHRSE